MKVKLGTTQVLVLQMDKKGEMQNAYSPLQNLINTNGQLGDFTTPNLKFDRYSPIDIIPVEEYDGSKNLILNDDRNVPRLINTRFSQLENNTFNIPVHSGNSVTNVYEDQTFDKDTQLLKLYDKIPSLSFTGIYDGGAFKCGSYIFYFKLGDADGNLSNIVQESSIVQIHMGTPSTKKIRMGMLDENALKLVRFKLSNIDAGFDYLRVFYERSSTDSSQAIIKLYYMINLNYPILNGLCELILTGEENIMQISKSDLQTEFADILTVKTLDIVDNTLFLGNVFAYEQNYQELQLIAWRIIPSIATEYPNIGSVDTRNYDFKNGCSYYDVKNSYENTGYWEDEYYRFGIVFIYNNNLLSPVFNILGCDLSKFENNNNNSPSAKDYFQSDGRKWELEPEDYFFKKNLLTNSKGVVKLPKSLQFTVVGGEVTPKVTRIKFDWKYIINDTVQIEGDSNTEDRRELYLTDSKNPYLDLFRHHNIKGFFFVRLKRIPTIIALGMVIGLTGKDNGAIPVLKNNNDGWITKSFLSNNRLLLENGSTVNIQSDNVTAKALLVPDYEVNEATLNQIFTGQEFQLEKIGSVENKILNDHHYTNKFSIVENRIPVNDVKLTAVPKNTKIRTDGENYFSSIAGNPDEAFKTADVNNIWNETPPQNLTASISLIRGLWGSYVGMSSNRFAYGDIVNIKLNTFKDYDSQNILEFEKRFKDFSLYSAISPRVNISDYNVNSGGLNMICSRGDCYLNVFTHRMMSNFIDPELPTNKKIIDPGCWASNYAVRCTAEILSDTHSNLTGDSEGWYIPSPVTGKKSSIISLIFGILTANIGIVVNSISDLSSSKTSQPSQSKYANEVAQAFEIYTGKDSTKLDSDNTSGSDDGGIKEGDSLEKLVLQGHIKKVNPKELELLSGLNLKAIFKADDKWELHGLASINRADVNAVSFGSWITFPVCSSYNLALRDIDFNNATEEAKMNKKRSFYPYEEMDPEDHLLESGVINVAAKVSLSDYNYPAYTTVPYIKLEYFNRIYWSKPNVAEQFINSYRMIYNTQYREYNKEFGAITKILSLGNSLLVVFQHGVGLLSVNRSPQTELEASPYLPSKSVLPALVLTLTSDYGSMWKDSVLKTPQGFVYGVDTVAKKIWRVHPDGSNLEFISDHKVLKFLNDHITLSEFDYNTYQGHINVKTHYNEFKHDVMFTYYRDIPMTKHAYIKITDGFDKGSVVVCPIGTEFNRYSETEKINYFTWTNPHSGLKHDARIDSDGSVRIASAPMCKIVNYVDNGNNNSIICYPTTSVIVLGSSGDHKVISVTVEYISEDNNVVIYNKNSELSAGILVRNTDSYKIYYDYKDTTFRFLNQNISDPEYKSESEFLDLIKYRPVGLSGNLILSDTLDPKPLIDFWEKGETWNLCYNEILGQWTTFYDWFPVESCNVDNIYFSFNKELIDSVYNKREFADKGLELEGPSIVSNKVFMDKAFTHNTKIYTLKRIDFFHDLKKEDTHISFYYLKTGNSDPILTIGDEDLSNYTTYNLGKDASWYFAVATINPESIKDSLLFELENSSCKISEVKVHSFTDELWNKIDKSPDSVFKYWELRNSEANQMYLWKHGQAGLYDNQGKIKPTHWYGKLHEWNFEFIVNELPGMLKIFNNLLLISNKAAPYKFEYEVVGEGYEWYMYKEVINWINSKVLDRTFETLYDGYLHVLSNKYQTLRVDPTFPEIFGFDGELKIKKLPFLAMKLTDQNGMYYDPDIDFWTGKTGDYTLNSTETCLIEDEQLNENKIHTEQLGQDMKKYGRLRGNMLYLEDNWKVEIRPISFQYAYLEGDEVKLTSKKYETRHRDKFIRIKIRYDGKDLAVIQGVNTLFDYSFA